MSQTLGITRFVTDNGKIPFTLKFRLVATLSRLTTINLVFELFATPTDDILGRVRESVTVPLFGTKSKCSLVAMANVRHYTTLWTSSQL